MSDDTDERLIKPPVVVESSPVRPHRRTSRPIAAMYSSRMGIWSLVHGPMRSRPVCCVDVRCASEGAYLCDQIGQRLLGDGRPPRPGG